MDKTPRLILAPMAGISDSAFRTLALRWGADEVVSEMISSKAVVFGDKKTFSLAHFTPPERPYRIQIFGSEPEIMAESVKILNEKFSPDGFDINMGCPVGKIVKNGEGSALMKKPALVEKIVSSCVRAGGSTPVSVKIRAGFDEGHKNAVEIAKICESAGADRVAVHGRTREQMYKPSVDLDIIAKVRENLKIPVIANGDITSFESAKKTVDVTGCDMLMIGRGAMGRVWLFSEIKNGFCPIPDFEIPTGEKLIELIEEHMRLAICDKGEARAVRECRVPVSAYIRSMRGAAQGRCRINAASTFDEVRKILHELLLENS